MNPPPLPVVAHGAHRPSSLRSRRRRLVVAGAVVAPLVVLGSACSTTYDPTFATTATTVAATTTTLPVGAAVDLLPALRTEAASLSGVMIAEGDDGAVLERILALWDATRAEIGRERPDLVPGFQQNVDLAAKAVQFSRAADADKAAKNIDALVSAFLDA